MEIKLDKKGKELLSKINFEFKNGKEEDYSIYIKRLGEDKNRIRTLKIPKELQNEFKDMISEWINKYNL